MPRSSKANEDIEAPQFTKVELNFLANKVPNVFDDFVPVNIRVVELSGYVCTSNVSCSYQILKARFGSFRNHSFPGEKD